MAKPAQAPKAAWPDRIALFLLQFGVSLLLVSRGWLTWKWDSPIRGLFWEEKWWTPVLANFDITWEDYANTSDTWITPTLEWTGIFLMAAAILPWLAMIPRLHWTRWLLILPTLILAIDAFGRWFGKDLQAGTAMEYALRILCPLVLILLLRPGALLSKTRRVGAASALLLATALTFTGHGLYAMGYYDVPLNFRMMTSEILPLTEPTVLFLLKIAGWLDFVVVAMVLIPVIPNKRFFAWIYMIALVGALAGAAIFFSWEINGWLGFLIVTIFLIPFAPNARLLGLIYMVLWGGATTTARVLAYYEPTLPWNGLDPWLAEALVRTPHWLVPLWLIIILRKRKPVDQMETGGDLDDSTESVKIPAGWD